MFKILSRKKDHKNKNPFLLYKSSRYNINSPDINQYWNDLVSKQHTCIYTVILYTLPWQIMELYDICFITFNHTSQESHDVAEILLKLALNTNQSINQSHSHISEKIKDLHGKLYDICFITINTITHQRKLHIYIGRRGWINIEWTWGHR